MLAHEHNFLSVSLVVYCWRHVMPWQRCLRLQLNARCILHALCTGICQSRQLFKVSLKDKSEQFSSKRTRQSSLSPAAEGRPVSSITNITPAWFMWLWDWPYSAIQAAFHVSIEYGINVSAGYHPCSTICCFQFCVKVVFAFRSSPIVFCSHG